MGFMCALSKRLEMGKETERKNMTVDRNAKPHPVGNNLEEFLIDCIEKHGHNIVVKFVGCLSV